MEDAGVKSRERPVSNAKDSDENSAALHVLAKGNGKRT
jgi:hypothetical protein